ncbi:TolC family protein [Flavobacterium agrisoli]|uniref:TolC family protein n=1 Tax=Flavobacterium agrisoli TaxID=2793066 RepID=A0A934PM56_9FLAO|nr:TolC family protein [Flavobacterium agrisoli]MBK0369365.1 TolC family protein [Flavobacterium agrisoli]
MKNVLTLLLLAIGITATAQEAKVLTLKDAIQYALENKAEAVKAKLQVENSEYKIQEIRAMALPQIAANGNLTYNPILQTQVIDGAGFGQPGTTIQAVFGQKWTSTAGVNLNQNIFNQAIFTGLRAAQTTREFYQVNKDLTDEQVIEKVASNFYSVHVQRLRLHLLDSNYVNTAKVLDIIKGQYDNGLAKKIDLDRTTVKLSNIDAQRQQVLNSLQLQENTLKFFIGMPIATEIIIPQREFEVTPLNLSEIPNMKTRNEYMVVKKQEELLVFNKKSIEAEYYPTLSLNAGYNFIGQGPEFPWFARPDKGVYWSDFSAIGLNLNVPIFTGFGTRARVRQADIEIRTAQQDLIDTELALDLDYKNALVRIENSLSTIKSQEENRVLADAIMRDTKNNYMQGLASLTDLLDAQNAYIEAENNYTSAILEYKLAEVQLIKSKGELKTLINN